MSFESAQIPPRCAGLCELTQSMVDEYGIVMTRNCEGPSTFSGPVDKRTVIEGGIVTEMGGPSDVA